MTGGISVVGCVTGTHVIADISVCVPHRIAVFIPAEQVLRSKDLHRGLQQGHIMKLDGGSALRQDAPQPTGPDLSSVVARLEAENKQLRLELEVMRSDLEVTRARESGLQQAFAIFGGQLAGIQGALGRLESKEPVIQRVGGPSVATAPIPRGVVGGAAPVFIPSQITPETDDVSIQIATAESGESPVSDARTKLREMRRKAEG